MATPRARAGADPQRSSYHRVDVSLRAGHKLAHYEILAAELAPKPDVAPTIRKRPQYKPQPAPSVRAMQLCPDTVEAVAVATKPVPPAVPKQPATLEPLAPARYKVAYMAELDYGKVKMDSFRVCEPKPTYGVVH